jgi:competence protein ComEC
MTIDLRLAVPAVVAWCCAGVLIGFPSLLPWFAWGCWTVAAILTGLAMRHRRRRLVMGIVIAATAALVISVAAAREPERRPEFLLRAASSGRHLVVTAVTTQTIHSGDRRFAATMTSLRLGKERTGVSVPMMVFGGAPRGSTGIGTTIELSGTVSATDPGEDVAFLFFARGGATTTVPPPWFLDWANALRAGFHDIAARLPGEGGDLLPGLAIGDTSAVSSGLDLAMKSSSLSHLTAVSGANCAVVIALIMLAGGAIGLGRGWRIGISSAVLLGFVVLVTPEPSVLRAAVMAGLVLLSLASGRPVRGVPVLALAAIVLLTLDPWLARSYGFILSVLATAGLLLLSRPLTMLLARWLPLSISTLLAIPLAAQLACQPVLIMLNPAVPLYAIPANVLAEPAAPLATVLGLAACLLVPAVPALGLAVARLAWAPSAWIAAVARFFAGLPGATIPWLPGVIGAVAIAVITALVLVAALAGRMRRLRIASAAGLALLLVTCLGVVGGDRIRRELSRPGDWQIAACDIGQGDAVLVRSSGRIALIDTGPDPVPLTHCLDALGVGRIDLLVLSHYDLDHVGGTAAVLGRVDRVMIGPPADVRDDALAERLRRSGARVHQTARGESGMLGELRWDVLWPPSRLRGIEPGNDASVTVEFSGAGLCAQGCLHSVFLGDLGDEPQARMMAANRLGTVDVVKVAHHGSADQNPALYQRLSARIGIVSVGNGNDYGHPTASLLDILKQTGTAVARTDREGMVLVSPRQDGGLSLWTERAYAGNAPGTRRGQRHAPDRGG